MGLLLILSILAAAPQPPAQPSSSAAVALFEANFGTTTDVDGDRWPDGWRRKRGLGLPHYLRIGLANHPSPYSDRSLLVDLDGGGAIIWSPAVQVEWQRDFVLEGSVQTAGLVHDQALISLLFLDADQQLVSRTESRAVRETNGWTTLHIGPISPSDARIRYAVIALHVGPTDEQDLRGQVWFDHLVLKQLPRLDWTTGRKLNLFAPDEPVELRCHVHGAPDNARLTFELRDAFDQVVARNRAPLVETDTVEVQLDEQREVDTIDTKGDARRTDIEITELEITERITGQVTREVDAFRWVPSFHDAGFYRAVVSLEGPRGVIHQQQTSLALCNSARTPEKGPYAWSVPNENVPLGLEDSETLLSQAGINAVKLPLWNLPSTADGEYWDGSGTEDDDKFDRWIDLIERLDSRGIDTIGMLSDPPQSLRTSYAGVRQQGATILLLGEPELWYPTVEPLLARLSLAVSWWQIGSDYDTDLNGFNDLAGKVAKVKAEFDRIGQDVNLALPATWINPPRPGANPLQPGAQPPWRALSLSDQPPTTAAELARDLATRMPHVQQRWVAVEPLPRDSYSLTDRVTDLAQRMLTAKIGHADKVFVPNPFDDQAGLLDTNGQPSELLLPWRTLALALADAEYLGQWQLAGGSSNRVFRNEHGIVMIAWNSHPVREMLYGATGIQQHDLWGRAVPILAKTNDGLATVQLDALPTLITGLSEALTRTRLSVRLAESKLVSRLEVPQAQTIVLKNHFARPIQGTIQLRLPRRWRAEPSRFEIQMAEGEELKLPLEITLAYDALIAHEQVALEFDLRAEQVIQFTAIEPMEVDGGDVAFDVTAWLNSQNELEIQQRFFNNGSKPVSFRCEIIAPSRRGARSQINWQGPGASSTTYRLPDGERLLGVPLRLKATEIDGSRVLNYQFEVQGDKLAESQRGEF